MIQLSLLSVEKAVSCYKSGPICSLVAKFSQSSVVACSTQILCCRGRTLRTRLRTNVCEPLMPDVVAPKAHHKKVSSADLPSTQNFLHSGRLHGEPRKPQNCQNWGVDACSGQYGKSYTWLEVALRKTSVSHAWNERVERYRYFFFFFFFFFFATKPITVGVDQKRDSETSPRFKLAHEESTAGTFKSWLYADKLLQCLTRSSIDWKFRLFQHTTASMPHFGAFFVPFSVFLASSYFTATASIATTVTTAITVARADRAE